MRSNSYPIIDDNMMQYPNNANNYVRFGWQDAREDEASRGHRDVPSSGGFLRLRKGQPITVRRVDEMEVRLPLAWKSHPVLIDPHPPPSLHRRLRALLPSSTSLMLSLIPPLLPSQIPFVLTPCPRSSSHYLSSPVFAL